jgi:hypothetical protein
MFLDSIELTLFFTPLHSETAFSGKIVHIYTHRGGYKAGKEVGALDFEVAAIAGFFLRSSQCVLNLAFVPRRFRSLRRISMVSVTDIMNDCVFYNYRFLTLTSKAGNMLSDHMAKAYYEGLLEVKAVRAAKQDLPHWVGFADDCTCACCASLFTWASTSNTEAQAARDKHNCRACGGLVCDPCSKKRIPIPAIGITAPVRVCDRCYNGWGALYGDLEVSNNALSGGAGTSADMLSSMDNRGEKKRALSSRRSAVVDELASRIPSISC